MLETTALRDLYKSSKWIRTTLSEVQRHETVSARFGTPNFRRTCLNITPQNTRRDLRYGTLNFNGPLLKVAVQKLMTALPPENSVSSIRKTAAANP